MFNTRTIGAAVMLALSPACMAADGMLLQAGLHFGGDDLLNVRFTNGDTEKLKAGELISLSAGVALGLSEKLETRLLFGIKLDAVDADNGDASFTRLPLDALLMYRLGERVSLGGGATYHLDPTLEYDGPSTSFDVNYDDALGLVLQAEYDFEGQGYMALKFTSIDYEVDGISGDASGNSVGIILGMRF